MTTLAKRQRPGGHGGDTLRYRLMWYANRVVMRTLFRMRVEGLDHLPDAPYQLVANHHNGMDPMLVMAVTPRLPRITWFGPREADFSRGFKNRVMAFFGGVIPYDPGKTRLTSAVRAVRAVFASGGVLGIFAEGRVGFRESALLPFEEGAAGFAISGRVPVVPCAIVGSTWLWFGRRIVIRFGPPIEPGASRGHDQRSAFEERLRSAVAALLPVEEPRLPHRRPGIFLTDLLNGAEDAERRRAEQRDD